MSADVWWQVEGVSMWPLRAPLQVRLSQTETYLPGDIIGFIGDRPGTLVLHRVVGLCGDQIEARGDTNRYADAPVPRQAVIGKLAAVRLDAVVVQIPEHGVRAVVLRRLGQAWSHLAPVLRSGVATLRQRG